MTPNPNAHTYPHSHLPHGFPLTVVIASTNVTVDEAMSDKAWNNRYYTGDLVIAGGTYERKSSSTFTKNCWAFAVGAPTVMFNEGWQQWTESAGSCDSGWLTRGIGEGHCIFLNGRIKYESTDPECYIVLTKEKYASSGEYLWSIDRGARGQDPTGWTIRRKRGT
jgi:hypothetical protein